MEAGLCETNYVASAGSYTLTVLNSGNLCWDTVSDTSLSFQLATSGLIRLQDFTTA
jgi:hypothetical protein